MYKNNQLWNRYFPRSQRISYRYRETPRCFSIYIIDLNQFLLLFLLTINKQKYFSSSPKLLFNYIVFEFTLLIVVQPWYFENYITTYPALRSEQAVFFGHFVILGVVWWFWDYIGHSGDFKGIFLSKKLFYPRELPKYQKTNKYTKTSKMTPFRTAKMNKMHHECQKYPKIIENDQNALKRPQ